MKKAENGERYLIHKILDMVLDINGLNPREQEKTGNLPTVFLRFSGHVGVIEISTHSSGWKVGDHADKEYSACTYREEELEGAIAYLEELKNETPAGGAAGESR